MLMLKDLLFIFTIKINQLVEILNLVVLTLIFLMILLIKEYKQRKKI